MSLTGSVSVNLIGRVGSAVIGMLASVYLANLLGPEPLGVYFVILSVVAIAKLPVGAITAGVTKRISEGEDKSEFVTGGFMAVGAYVLTISIIGLTATNFLKSFITGETSITALLIFLFVSRSFFILIRAILTGEKKVGTAGVIRFTERSGRAGFQAGLAFFTSGVFALVAGNIISLIISIVIGALFVGSRFSLPKRHHFTSIWDFSKYSWISTIESTAFGWMDTFMLNFFVSSFLIGIYDIGWLLSSSLVMISAAVSQTIYPEISKSASEGDLKRVKRLVRTGITYAGIFVLPGIVGVLLIGKQILSIYGSEFTTGTEILLFLTIAQAFGAYRSVIIGSIQALNRPDLAFKILLISITSNVSLNFILIKTLGWIGAAIATTTSVAITLLLGYKQLHTLLNDFRIPWPEVSYQILSSTLMGVFLFTVTTLVDIKSRVATLVIVVASAGIYLLVLIHLSNQVREKLIQVVSIRSIS